LLSNQRERRGTDDTICFHAFIATRAGH
jgi:hypothetical protein